MVKYFCDKCHKEIPTKLGKEPSNWVNFVCDNVLMSVMLTFTDGRDAKPLLCQDCIIGEIRESVQRVVA